MVVPLIGRVIAAVVGGLLVLTVAASVIGTIIVPRPVGSWLSRLVDRLATGAYRLVVAPIADYQRRDRVLAGQAAVILLAQLIAWLGMFFIGYSHPLSGNIRDMALDARRIARTLQGRQPGRRRRSPWRREFDYRKRRATIPHSHSSLTPRRGESDGHAAPNLELAQPTA